MSCPKCNRQFEQPNRRAIMGVCGHSVCYDCTQKTWNWKEYGSFRACLEASCPLCKDNRAFRVATDTRQLNDIIAEFQSSQKFVKLHELCSKTLLKCHCCGTIVEEDKVRFCETCPDENSSVFDEYGTVDKENLEASALCASCFLDGPHKGHNSVRWVAFKLRSKMGEAVSNLRDAKNRVKSRLQEEFQNLMDSLDSVDQSLNQLENDVKPSGNGAAHFKEIIETCIKELEVCEGLGFGEQITEVEATNEKLASLRLSDSGED